MFTYPINQNEILTKLSERCDWDEQILNFSGRHTVDWNGNWGLPARGCGAHRLQYGNDGLSGNID